MEAPSTICRWYWIPDIPNVKGRPTGFLLGGTKAQFLDALLFRVYIVILFFADIDECTLTNSTTRCQHHCVDTKGSYLCTCFEGYYLDTDGVSCIGNIIESP